jgi:hypothetical protein
MSQHALKNIVPVGGAMDLYFSMGGGWIMTEQFWLVAKESIEGSTEAGYVPVKTIFRRARVKDTVSKRKDLQACVDRVNSEGKFKAVFADPVYITVEMVKKPDKMDEQ